ncbi:MAG: glycosyltransferase family 4 protein [Chloroflexi bacterium]|nr:glycosyltransferase family 4 protein [Chloroflexota bacterium]
MPHSGVGTYTANLLQHLQRYGGDQVLPMAQTCGRSSGIRLNKTLWMQVLLPFQLARVAPDVCHFTNSVASCWTPCPAVVTIHDTTLWMFPRYHPRRRLLAMRPLIPLAARRARAIIAVSAATRRDLLRILKVPEHKVHVIHEAPGRQFRPLVNSALLASVRARYGLPTSFVLYVGTIEPRKNLPRLLRAFQLARRQGFSTHALVLVGHRGWKDAAVMRRVEELQLDGSVRMLGYVPTEDLVALYNLAEVLAFPSLYEGFGLPVVEAMACGTPVLTSPRGSLAEVAGDAAEFVDPLDVESIGDGLRRLLEDRNRRGELRAAGLARAARFHWDETAARTRRVYELARRG